MFKKLFKKLLKKINKRSSRSYSSVSGEIQEWLRSLVVRLNWLNEFCRRSLSADEFFIAGISLNDLSKQERLPSLRYVSKHFLFDRSLFSFAMIFHRSASRHERDFTSKELRNILLTFTILIIQLQVGAIPVFSR